MVKRRSDITSQQILNKCSDRDLEFIRVSLFDDTGEVIGSQNNPIYVLSSSALGQPYKSSTGCISVEPDTLIKIYELDWTDPKTLNIQSIRCLGDIRAMFKLELLQGTETFTERRFSPPSNNLAIFDYFQLLQLKTGNKLSIYCQHSYKNSLNFEVTLLGTLSN